MKKFVDTVMALLGYKNPCLEWNDFNNEIQMLIVKRSAYSSLLVLCFVAFAIITNNLLFYIVSSFFIVIAIISPLSLLYAFKCDCIYIVEGTCTSVNKNANKRTLGIRYGKSSITVEDDTNIYMVPVPHYSMFTEKKVVRIYFRQNEVYKKTDTLYNIYNPVLVIPLHSIDY